MTYILYREVDGVEEELGSFDNPMDGIKAMDILRKDDTDFSTLTLKRVENSQEKQTA